MEIDLLPATKGAGPLLQRDYWAVFADCPLKPSELIAFVKANFCQLPPPSLAQFVAESGMACGAELAITITPAINCRVRVVHEDAQSITLATLAGHPEAGRITFGAYRNPKGELVFHIRSRARSATTARLVGFLTMGEAMQTNTWTDFINRTAALVGAKVRDAIHADTESVDETADDETLSSPTFAARGD